MFLFYVLHQTAIVLVAFAVVRWDAGAGAKFAVIATASLLMMLALVEAARLWRPARKLFGLRRGTGDAPG